jgi:hypothetical protein
VEVEALAKEMAKETKLEAKTKLKRGADGLSLYDIVEVHGDSLQRLRGEITKVHSKGKFYDVQYNDRNTAKKLLPQNVQKVKDIGDVLADNGAGVLLFHNRMCGIAVQPSVPFTKLVEFVKSRKLDPWNVIDFDERTWNDGSYNGCYEEEEKGRRHLAGRFTANILKHLQAKCGCGCGESFAAYPASAMSGIDLHHKNTETKTANPSVLLSKLVTAATQQELRGLTAVLTACHPTEASDGRRSKAGPWLSRGVDTGDTGQPNPKDTAEVMETPQGKAVFKFHDTICSSGKEPAVSFAALKEFVEEQGLDPLQVISFDEQKWIAPSPKAVSELGKPNPGASRSHLAAKFTANMLKLLQWECGCGCGRTFARYPADRMGSIQLHHKVPPEKTNDPSKLLKTKSNARIGEELRGCTAVLRACHGCAAELKNNEWLVE